MKSKLMSLATGVALLLMAQPALASSWTTTFSPGSVSSYLHGKNLKIAVVPGGSAKDPSAIAAARALAKASRGSGKINFVMDSSAVNHCSKDEDRRIVGCLSSLSLDVIAVVRTFPGDTGQPDGAVVVLYDRYGKTLNAFSATNGVALTAHSVTSFQELEQDVGQGVTEKAADTILEITKQEAENKETALERYERKAFNLSDAAMVNVKTGHVMSRWTEITQGKYKKHIDPEQFYRIVGREDLASTYQKRNQTKILLMVGGLVGSGVGLWMTVRNPNDEPFHEPNMSGVAVLSVAAGAGFIGALINPQPVSASEMRELASEYNDDLKEKLGLSDASEVIDDDESFELAIAPAIFGDRAGMTLSFAF